MDATRLSRFPLFAELPETERETLATIVAEEEVEAGRTIARAGDFGYAVYALESGTADVIDADGAVLGTLGPGDTFGEIAVLFAGRRSATVVATSPMRALSIFARDFLRIRASVPAFEAALRALGNERLLTS